MVIKKIIKRRPEYPIFDYNQRHNIPDIINELPLGGIFIYKSRIKRYHAYTIVFNKYTSNNKSVEGLNATPIYSIEECHVLIKDYLNELEKKRINNPSR